MLTDLWCLKLILHRLIGLRNRGILNLRITRGTSYDSPILKRLLKSIAKDSGDACLDAAYLSTCSCNFIAKKGRSPIIKPKRNTTIQKREANHGVRTPSENAQLQRQNRQPHNNQRAKVK